MTKGERDLLTAMAMTLYEMDMPTWCMRALDEALQIIREEKSSEKGWK